MLTILKYVAPWPFLRLQCAPASLSLSLVMQIGDFSQARDILTVWAPDRLWYNFHAVAAYAKLVKERRDADGRDTVAVHFRQRIEKYDPVSGTLSFLVVIQPLQNIYMTLL